MKDLLSLQNWNNDMIIDLISYASEIKKNPEKYFDILKNKTMLMIFEKPSLRTRVSFEVGMTQLGGHAIYMDIKDSPLGKKESIEDTAKASSRYVDIIMARLFSQDMLEKLAKNSKVPVINGLTDIFHPCQMLSDLFTIHEKKKKLKGISEKGKLHIVIGKVANDLEKHHSVRPNILKPLRVASSDKHSLLSPETFGEYVHGVTNPIKKDLIRTWDSYESAIKEVLKYI